MKYKLNNLAEGKSAIVISVENKNLINLGLTEKTLIKCIKKNQKIAAYFFRGKIMAIRDLDSENIIVESSEDHE